MDKFKVNWTQRVFYLFLSFMLMVGIWLTGFDTVHWFLYFPPAVMVVTFATGYCPSIGMFRALLPEK